jgi:type I restriction enzyme S subunit
MKLKQYPKYKDSGIQWIGEIPEEWETNKLKHNFLALSKSSLEASEGDDEGKFPFFTSSKIQDKFIDKAIFDDDCLVLGTGGVACVHHVKSQFSVSTDCLTLKKEKKENNMRFLYYQVLSQIDVIDDLGFWGMGLRHLQKHFFYNLLSHNPQVKEQNSIVNFLDSKTSQLDQTIEKDKELIELLKEKRTALINYVVTKGLDPKAKMKDSGIDWIGDIPEGWEVRKFKHLTSNLDGKRIPISADSRERGKIPYYGATGILDYVEGYLFDETLLLVGEDGAPFFEKNKDVAFIVKGKSWVNNHAHVLRVIKNNSPFWLCYFMNSNDYSISIKGSTRDKLNQYDLSNIPVAVPPKQEQSQIVEYLDKATSKIDQTINKIQEKITLMEEYKKSLIHHVVTGKVDVREAVA